MIERATSLDDPLVLASWRSEWPLSRSYIILHFLLSYGVYIGIDWRDSEWFSLFSAFTRGNLVPTPFSSSAPLSSVLNLVVCSQHSISRSSFVIII